MPQQQPCLHAPDEFRVTGELHELPRFGVQQYRLYRLSFESACPTAAYWVVDFFDENGQRSYADNYSGLDAAPVWQRTTSVFMARVGTTSARVAFRPIDAPVRVRDVRVTEIDRGAALAWADALYSGLPPVEFTPSPARWHYLERTRDRLCTGGSLRLLVLGDSIANDTINSNFHLLVERAYRGARITLIHSTHPEKGCAGYRHDQRVHEYVVRHAPDLVMIMGMSHGNDAEAVGAVVNQIRAEIDPDIAHVTVSIRDEEARGMFAPPAFLQALCRIGAQQRFAVLDLCQPWEDYRDASPHPPAWYKRDSHHANDRGKQILGRMLARFLSPD